MCYVAIPCSRKIEWIFLESLKVGHFPAGQWGGGPQRHWLLRTRLHSFVLRRGELWGSQLPWWHRLATWFLPRAAFLFIRINASSPICFFTPPSSFFDSKQPHCTTIQCQLPSLLKTERVSRRQDFPFSNQDSPGPTRMSWSSHRLWAKDLITSVQSEKKMLRTLLSRILKDGIKTCLGFPCKAIFMWI